MEYQLPFDFIGPMDDDLNGTIEGLNPGAWLTRCYYPTAAAGILAAKRAAEILICPIYVTEYPVDKGFEKYWPHPTLWRAATNKPFYGKTIGAFYHPRPNHYIINLNSLTPEIFIVGETAEEIARKSKEARDNFDKIYKRG